MRPTPRTRSSSVRDLIGAVIDFAVIALVLFLIVSKIVSRVPKKAAAPTKKPCEFCLEQIPRLANKCKACASAV